MTSVNPEEGVFYALVESMGMVREFDTEELCEAVAAEIEPGRQFIWETGIRDDGGSRERYSRLDLLPPKDGER